MMSNNARQVVILENALERVVAYYRENKVTLISVWLVGLLAHTFAFTNKLTNPDDVFHLFGKGHTLSSGRWGLDLMQYIFPDYSMPWVYGILTIAILSVAICEINHIFHVKNKLLQSLLSGCIISFPALTDTFAFMFTATSYATAFLLAVLTVKCAQKVSGGYGSFDNTANPLSVDLSILHCYCSQSAGASIDLSNPAW